MTIRSMLQENGFKLDTRLSNIAEVKFSKVNNILTDVLNGTKSCTERVFSEVVEILEAYTEVQGDIGNCDIHDLCEFLKLAPEFFDKQLIKYILGTEVLGNNHFNPKSYGYDKKVLDPYIKILKRLHKLRK